MNAHLCRLQCGVLAALGSLSLGAGCLTADAASPTLPSDLPPVTQPPSGEHLAGKVIWHELVTPDLAAAKQFYAGLFGWTFREVDANYSVAYLGDQALGGVFQRPMPAGQHRQPLWLTFIAVRNVASAAQTAQAQHNAAKVLAPPKSYPNRGEQAVIADPEGALFAVLASSSGDPSDYLAGPGEWIWSALLVRDPDQEAAFYQNLFDYEVFDVSEGDPQQVILSSEGYARATVTALPFGPGRGRPHWLNFVRVQDAGSAAAKAASLGGRVLVQPRLDRHGGKIAVIADPAGAPVGLMEWNQSGAQSGQEPK